MGGGYALPVLIGAVVHALASYKCGWESCRESFLNVNLKVEKRKPFNNRLLGFKKIL